LSQEQLLMLPLWYVVFLLSITCHEAAHAFAAYRGGDPTAYLGGQVTLNPIPHVRREIFGTVLIPLITFLNMGWMMGWASAPYDPYWEDRHPRRAALMAAAGPVANLGLAVMAFVVLKIGLTFQVWSVAAPYPTLDRLVMATAESPGLWDGLGRFCSVMLTLNVVLFLFNLIPLPPMDGAGVVAGLFEPARALRARIRANPLSALVGLLIAWYLFRYLFRPVYGWVLMLLYS
jgi:Zn-dependent protease